MRLFLLHLVVCPYFIRLDQQTQTGRNTGIPALLPDFQISYLGPYPRAIAGAYLLLANTKLVQAEKPLSMNTTAIMTKSTYVNTWTPFSKLTVEDKLVFDDAIKGFLGAQCNARLVSVATEATGTNYRFKCTTVLPPSATRHDVIVEIFNPLESNDPYITGIYRE